MASTQRRVGPQPGDLLKIGPNITMVAVGSVECPSPYSVHTGLLRKHSNTFGSVYHRGDTGRPLAMPDVLPSVFRHVFSWLYTGDLGLHPRESPSSTSTSSATNDDEKVLEKCIQLYQFAYRYGFPALRHQVMVQFHNLFRKDPAARVAERVFQVVLPHTSMYRYVIDGLIQLWFEDGAKRAGVTELPIDAQDEMDEAWSIMNMNADVEADRGMDADVVDLSGWVEVEAMSVFAKTNAREVDLMMEKYEEAMSSSL